MQDPFYWRVTELLLLLKEKFKGPNNVKDSAWSWLVTLSSFILVLSSAGFHASFGLMFSSFIQEFGSSRGKTAVVGSLMISLTYLLSPLASMTAERWGLRVTAWLGVSLLSLSLMLTSFASSIEAMYASFGILGGLGASFMYMPTFVVLNYYFTNKASLATGIVAAGLPFQTIALTPLYASILEHKGWRYLLRVMSLCVCVVGLTAGSTYVPTTEEQEEMRRMQLAGRNSGKFGKYLEILKVPSFSLYILCSLIFGFGVNVINVHQIQYALELGMSWKLVSIMPLYMGIASATGRIICGKLFQSQILNTITLFQIVLALTGFMAIVTPLARSYIPFVLCSSFYMVFDGAAVGVQSVPTAYITGRRYFMQGWSISISAGALSMILGSPVAGWVADYTNNYEDVYYITGIPFLFASALLTAVHYLPRSDDLLENHYFSDITRNGQEVKLSSNDNLGVIYQKITVFMTTTED